ncbi:MAG: DUF3011 domain-containing protein [Thermomonas sp.]|uniref:DUF3011 domain-containing protein n=1 Tax=Thermomonas sp. TaxID=1971895 RepID=UPI0039E555B0
MRTLIAVAATMLAASAMAPASAQSYGGSYGYNNGYNGYGEIIRCESNDGRPRECSTGGGRVALERQLSKAACIEGRSWGYGRNGVWVSQGCRADFRVLGYGNDYGNGQYDGYGQTFRCESNDGRTQHCMVNGRGRVELVRQLSKSACIEGRSWGSDRNGVWVAQGCRAEFAVSSRGGYDNGWGNSGYGGRVFRCESNDGRTSECAANTRTGVQLLRQLSKAPCIQGRSWGYGRNGIWVSQGCRAEFRSY